MRNSTTVNLILLYVAITFIIKRIWKPVVGEKLTCKQDKREEAQLYDEFAIGTYVSVNDGEQKLLEHVPIELSFLLCKVLARDGCRKKRRAGA